MYIMLYAFNYEGNDAMENVSIFTSAPQKIIKGAGIKNTQFVPAWVYTIKLDIKNESENTKLCSFNSTLANGLSFVGNMKIDGPDKDILETIHVVEPTLSIGNDNIIIFANNFKLSKNSINTLSFDVALNDCYTINSVENSGEKIPHKSILNIFSHLLCDGVISSSNASIEAVDYELCIHCDDLDVHTNETTKLYIECKASQYDIIRKVYIRAILDSGIKYLTETSNIDPNNVYTYDNRTILKWNIDLINPGECKKIGFKIKIKPDYTGGDEVLPGDTLNVVFNSNGVINSTYAQSPDTVKYKFNVVEGD